MRKTRKILPFILGIMLTASMLGGCNKASSNTLDFSNTTISGIITAVDGDNVTISMTSGFGGGRMGNRNSDNEDSATPKEKPEGFDGEMPPNMPEDFDGKMPEDFDGKMPENMPEGFDGEKPDMNNADFGNMFAQGGSTFTLTIKDTSVLSECTMEDIETGSMITITLGENNTITSITVMKLSNSQEATDAPDDAI